VLEVEYKLTPAISSISELHTVDVQRHAEVHRPPRVRLQVGATAQIIVKMCAAVAVVGVTGRVRTKCVGPNADLVRRTIESDVHIEASFRRHCTSKLRSVSLLSVHPGRIPALKLQGGPKN